MSDKTDESTSSKEAFSVCVMSKTTTFRLIVLYADFHSDFTALLDKYVPKPGPLLIVGDYNIHWDRDCLDQ